MAKQAWSDLEFQALYDTYAVTLYQICILRLANKEDAEDAVQDTFIRAYTKMPLLPPEEAKAWLIRVAVNLCKDYRKSIFRKRTVSLEQAAQLSSAPLESVEAMLEFYQLPPAYRTILQLYYLEGYSQKEIASLLGMKESSVSSKLCRARKRLRMELEESAPVPLQAERRKAE